MGTNTNTNTNTGGQDDDDDVSDSTSASVMSRSDVMHGSGRRGGTRARKTSMSGSQSDGSDSGENSGDWSDSASGYDDQDESSSDIGDSSSVSVQSRSDHPTSAVKPSRTSNNRQTSVESTTGEETVEQDVDSS